MNMENDDRVIGIPPDTVMEDVMLMQSDDWYITPGIKELHRRGVDGRGNRFCIGDTGGTKGHPALKDPLQMIDNTGNNPNDRNGHGTACSYITHVIAPGADYVTIKVLSDSGSGQMNWINRAYRQAGEMGCNFYNGSYGDNGGPDIPSDIAAIDAGYAAGLQLVNIAAGNAGFNGNRNTIGRPATYHNTGCTGSTDRNDRISGYSSGGSQLDWATHGQDMTYANPRGGFSRGSGTSFACPKMVGIFCLLNQVRRMLGFRDLVGRDEWREFFIDNKLLRDVGTPGEDPSYGIGIPDDGKMVQWMLDNTPKYV